MTTAVRAPVSFSERGEKTGWVLPRNNERAGLRLDVGPPNCPAVRARQTTTASCAACLTGPVRRGLRVALEHGRSTWLHVTWTRAERGHRFRPRETRARGLRKAGWSSLWLKPVWAAPQGPAGDRDRWSTIYSMRMYPARSIYDRIVRRHLRRKLFKELSLSLSGFCVHLKVFSVQKPIRKQIGLKFR